MTTYNLPRQFRHLSRLPAAMLVTLLLLMLSACQLQPPAPPADPVPPIATPASALPTYDARDLNALCFDLNASWDKDWPRVIYSLEKVREQRGSCNNQDPALMLYPAYFNYGAWLEAKGQFAAAIDAYQKALLINPNGREATAALKKHNVFTPIPQTVCGDQRIDNALASMRPYVPVGKGSYAKVQGSAITLDGTPFRIKGVNYYPVRAPWRRFLMEADLAVVAKELDLIKGVGFNTLRIFLWYEALFDCPGSGAVPKPESFARLDGIIKLAAERGFQIIVTLNDLPDLTAHPLYTRPDAPEAQTAYIVSRYVNESAILAWDLRNEGDIDYVRGLFPSTVVQDWLARTAAKVRFLDPNHLITAGWNDGAQATESVVDFLSFHHWNSQDRLKQRIATLRTYTQKPILLGEVGYSTMGGQNEDRQGTNLQAALAQANTDGLAGWLVWTAFDYPTDATCWPPDCPSKDNSEHHFGLWRVDYSAKPAVEMIKSLTRP